MGRILPPDNQWFANQIGQIKSDLAALKAGQTQYIVDAAGTCQAIVGSLTHDPAGNATGLSGFGIAVLVDGGWRSAQRSVPAWITPQQIVTWGNGSVAWTTYNLGPSGSNWLPVTAQAAILNVEVMCAATGAGYVTNDVGMRQTGTTAPVQLARARAAGTGAGSGSITQWIVELNSTQKLDLEKVDGANNSSSATVTLVGYM